MLASLFAFATGAGNPPFLSPVFTDHMVLQRGKHNIFWGWTKPGARVTVTIAGKKASGKSDAHGKWSVAIDPPAVGGPYVVDVDGPERAKLEDVLVGDVWLCGGQSNMEFGVGQTREAKEAIAASADPNLRIAIVNRQVGLAPKPTVATTWQVCGPETLGKGGWMGFSAVGYYFGKKLRAELGVPIGLVEDCWGGTSAEAWTGAAALGKFTQFAGDLGMLADFRKAQAPDYGTYLEAWLALNDPGSSPGAEYWRPETKLNAWIDLPTADASLPGKPAVAWYRKEIDLPNPLPEGRAEAILGRIGDVDGLWVNGKLVWGARRYSLWPNSITPGKNVFVVRAFSRSGRAGVSGPADRMTIRLGDGTNVPIGTDWKAIATVDAGSMKVWPRDLQTNPTMPTVLFNGMIAPVAPLAISGAIWYQGETNVGRGYEYRELLPAMITDWRRAFGQGEFPFYIVSLANFQRRATTPGDDGWAELREAQSMTAAKIKNGGLAVTIDVGEANDIHPKDKKTVGERLAAVALHQRYGKAIPYAGPTYRQSARVGSSIQIDFDHTDGGLVAKDGALEGFAIAGPDHIWKWATARIEGASVIVSSPEVSEPIAVRYAWASNPAATLYNGAGFPAVPFRTDDWRPKGAR